MYSLTIRQKLEQVLWTLETIQSYMLNKTLNYSNKEAREFLKEAIDSLEKKDSVYVVMRGDTLIGVFHDKNEVMELYGKEGYKIKEAKVQ